MRSPFYDQEPDEFANNSFLDEDFHGDPDNDWSICENCSSYLEGKCLLDMRTVNPKETCTYGIEEEENV